MHGNSNIKWSSGLVTHCPNVCYIFHFNVWLDTMGVMPHKEGCSTKYVVLQISIAVQNFGVLHYFSSLQHFPFWWMISKCKEIHSFLHTCKIVTFHSTSIMSKHPDILYIAWSRWKVVNYSSCQQWRTRNFVWGGFNKFSWGQRERGSGGGSPLVRGSGGSCNLVQEISFHMVNFS